MSIPTAHMLLVLPRPGAPDLSPTSRSYANQSGSLACRRCCCCCWLCGACSLRPAADGASVTALCSANGGGLGSLLPQSKSLMRTSLPSSSSSCTPAVARGAAPLTPSAHTWLPKASPFVRAGSRVMCCTLRPPQPTNCPAPVAHRAPRGPRVVLKCSAAPPRCPCHVCHTAPFRPTPTRSHPPPPPRAGPCPCPNQPSA